MTFLVVVGEGAVTGHPIEHRWGLTVSRIDPGFLDVFRVAGPVVPIIGIIADGHDDLAVRDLPDGGRNRDRPPSLRRDRPRRPVVRMLVIGHDEQLVGDSGESLEVP